MHEAIARARRAVTSVPLSHVTVVLGAAHLVVQFQPIARDAWQELTRRHPARPDVAQDTANGYNLTTLAPAFPDVAVTDPDGAQLAWAPVWEALAPADRRAVTETLWAAHELHPDAIATHPEEEAELAREMGVTVRELNGAAPVTITFDADGNLQSTSITEPRFNPHEKALLIASRRTDKAPRGHHGLPLAETTDPKNQFAYEVPAPTQDWAEKKLTEVQAQYRKSHPNADMDSLLWRVEKGA